MIPHRKMDYEIECDDDLYGCFDRELMTGVISNVLNNNYKDTKYKLHITAVKEQGYLVIIIKDNCPGYPEDMLRSNHANQKPISFDRESTGIVLYFSRLVAELHRNKERKGFITTINERIDG